MKGKLAVLTILIAIGGTRYCEPESTSGASHASQTDRWQRHLTIFNMLNFSSRQAQPKVERRKSQLPLPKTAPGNLLSEIYMRNLRFSDFSHKHTHVIGSIKSFITPIEKNFLQDNVGYKKLAGEEAASAACRDYSWFYKGLWEGALLTIMACVAIILLFTFIVKIF